MNHLNHCSRRPRWTRSLVSMPCEHLQLTRLLDCRRAPLHLMETREQQEYHRKCKIEHTYREESCQMQAGKLFMSLPRASSSRLPLGKLGKKKLQENVTKH
ncbi:hypothetical protein HU200_022994 [Digitaria exilis]|uniref:Uncharacterized protein n=1 Tax=Digitaria exilis TaxID=1010633 RepID=A0A835C227_9POAL|nr:hypothetical protein HU200_022994 [Digitaria exilis]